MKKSLLALGAACVALSGMAAAPMQKLEAPAKISFSKSADIQALGNLRVEKTNSLMKKAPAKIGAEDVITSVEGTKQNVTITGSGYYLFWGIMLATYENQQAASHIVYGENNEVYLYDIIPNFACQSYVKGVKDGDKITIDFPQTVLWDEDYQDGYSMTLFDYEETVDEDGEVSATYVPVENATLTLSIAEDGSMVAEGINEDRIIGGGIISGDNGWIGYGALELSIVPFNEEVVTVPADIEVTDYWTLIANSLGYGWSINWAQGYDEFYFQGFSEAMPEAWFKATVEYEDDHAVISVAQDQYVGDYAGYYIYTKCAQVIDDEFVLMPEDYVYQLIWDFEEGTITPKDADVSFLFNAAKDRVYYLDEFIDFTLIHQDSFAGTPQNPYGLEYGYNDYYGCYEFYFTVPAISTEGEALKTENLSYVIYIDGEEWEFDPEEYQLEEPMVEIPWSYYNPGGIWDNGGAAREVDFFMEGVSTIGVQSIYNYEGEETRSEIVTLDLDPTAVAGITADKKVTSVNYYDVAGRKVSNDAKGIVIKRVVYEDGTVASFKKAVR